MVGQKSEVPTCPVVSGVPFNPLDPDQAANVYPWLRVAQQDAPVFYMPEHDQWCVTRYDDVVAVLRDDVNFSARNSFVLAQLPESLSSNFPGGPPKPPFVSTDPPDHTRIREIAQRAFTPKLVSQLEESTRAICHESIDQFVDAGRCDLVDSFAERLPGEVICRLIGVPPEKREDFLQVSKDRASVLPLAPKLTASEVVDVAARLSNMTGWLIEFIDDRRASPREDLASALIHTEGENGEPSLTQAELITSITTILSAGTATTAHLIPSAVRAILSSDGVKERLLADRTLIKRAVEETLRHTPPVHGVVRMTNHDVDLGGTTIPAGATVWVHLAAAQHDETVFSAPDHFDFDRPNVNRQIGFGRGIHTCLGAPLARMEARIAVECLLERLPDLRMGPVDTATRWVPHMLVPHLPVLHLEWTVPDSRSGS